MDNAFTLSVASDSSEPVMVPVRDLPALPSDVLLDTLREPFLVLDRSLAVTFANRSFIEDFSVARDALIGHPVWEIWTSPSNGRIQFLLENLRTNIEEFKNVEVDVDFERAGRRALVLNGRRTRAANGEDLMLLAVEDVTHDHATQERIHDLEQRLGCLLDNLEVAYAIGDGTRTSFSFVSPGYEAIWGRSPADLRRMPSLWFDAIHPEDRDRVRRAVGRQARGKYREDYRILRPDGSMRWVRERAIWLRDDAGRPERLASIVEDITEVKRVENLLLEVSGREQRRIGQDMHDGVCQSLTGIKFLSKALHDKLGARGMPESQDAGEIVKLVSQALTQADVVAKGLCPVELDQNGCVGALSQLATGVARLRGVNVTVDCDDGLEIADQVVGTHVYRIAQEAVNNAVKHGHAKAITIRLTADGDRVSLSVDDDGVGIGRLAKRAGMGMHIMQFRARKIGAALTVQRRKEGGTHVGCTFQNVERTVKFGRRRDDKIVL